ncbi:MAG: DUF4870 domain-containing protein [Bacteroidales bacterium]|nr:DUF4870 domain-containing protein [Bacteroidales bacterium]
MVLKIRPFQYNPEEHEREKASTSYLMSLIALIAGLPLPIINLIATLAFYISNRKGTYFVRWHSTQALLSQFTLLIINGFAFWWTISIIFSTNTVTNLYISYIMAVVLYNITEFAATIFSAIKTRKGVHMEWWFYGTLTNQICRERL